MNHEKHQGNHGNNPGDATRVRWRPWPCESCGGGATALGYLVRSLVSDAKIPSLERNEEIDWLKRWEADRLMEWVNACPHTQWTDLSLPRLAEGSEHLVLFDQTTSEVVKVTRPGTYGDYYEIIEGKISQFDATPTEYLLRMHWWEEFFSVAPSPLGITDSGQILCRQKFIKGDPPEQEAVDRFLEEEGLEAVRKPCWLWKKVEGHSPTEVWIGDARADNFVSAQGEIIPIDIRLWGVPVLKS